MPVVIAFVSQKGGVGKSTLARALLAVAAHGLKVRLADLDPRQASAVLWEEARRRNVSGLGYDVVAYRSLVDALAAADDVDLLIIDTPAGTSPATVEIARAAHLVVQPTGASADDLVPAVLTFHELVNVGIPKDRLAAAVCRILTPAEADIARAYVRDAGYRVLSGSISERSAYREAQNRGRAITETRAAALNAHAEALIEDLLNVVTAEIAGRARPVKRRGS